MEIIKKKQRTWLLPAVLILFISGVVTFPMVIGHTYAGRSESPEHILTYTRNKLTWDSATGIDKNGVAELKVFDAIYDNVNSEDGQSVVAPGTDGYNIIRLKNSVAQNIRYTAVLYSIKSTEDLPIEAELNGAGFTDTDTYALPEHIDPKSVIRAVTGNVKGGEIQDFDIDWLWKFYENDGRDETDTMLGDLAAADQADEMTVGFWLVVTDDYSSGGGGSNGGGGDSNGGGSNGGGPGYVVINPGDVPLGNLGENTFIPGVPKTGDDGMLGMYITLMCISGVLLILMLVQLVQEKKCRNH